MQYVATSANQDGTQEKVGKNRGWGRRLCRDWARGRRKATEANEIYLHKVTVSSAIICMW